MLVIVLSYFDECWNIDAFLAIYTGFTRYANLPIQIFLAIEFLSNTIYVYHFDILLHNLLTIRKLKLFRCTAVWNHYTETAVSGLCMPDARMGPRVSDNGIKTGCRCIGRM